MNRFRFPLLLAVASTTLAIACRTAGAERQDVRAGREAPLTVEAGCGACVFKMPGVTGCPLAVRIDGRAYLVHGSDIDAHGDAHAPDGLCNAERRARVRGHLDADVFVAEEFVLLPPAGAEP